MKTLNKLAYNIKLVLIIIINCILPNYGWIFVTVLNMTNNYFKLFSTTIETH
jgi:type III secretory pathway component EscS